MSVSYTWVQWNRHKKVYDAIAVGGVVLYLALFVGIGSTVWRGEHAISPEILVLRALGTCAFSLLNVVLCIGPLSRLNRRFLPLLYNRRHLGVLMFLVAFMHGGFALLYYSAFGVTNPLAAILSGNTRFDSLTHFPFQILGMFGLVVLFLMAATSHDFWLKNLTPRVWKNLHMMVYLAWGTLVMHVALGALQSERSVVYVVMVGASVVTVASLHILAGVATRRLDKARASVNESPGWIEVGDLDAIGEDRAKIVAVDDDRQIAVFRYDGCVSAVANRCVHQGGPLGEGKIEGGCITCPWHGYQYRPEDGRSPPPYTEKIETYDVRINGRVVFVASKPNPAGTRVEPARVAHDQEEGHDD
jgi:nitrite reductase/ring-hydroxylating ferredoxin subunit/DMSO/TMAO reductase YedYZ heme-binding membrane subunit